jgi:hypothetical protein
VVYENNAIVGHTPDSPNGGGSGGAARVVPGHFGRNWAAEIARSGNRMKQKVKELA